MISNVHTNMNSANDHRLQTYTTQTKQEMKKNRKKTWLVHDAIICARIGKNIGMQIQMCGTNEESIRERIERDIELGSGEWR